MGGAAFLKRRSADTFLAHTRPRPETHHPGRTEASGHSGSGLAGVSHAAIVRTVVHRPLPSAIALRRCVVAASDHVAASGERAGCPQWDWPHAPRPLAASPARLVCVGARWPQATTLLRVMSRRAAPNGAGQHHPSARHSPLAHCLSNSAPLGADWAHAARGVTHQCRVRSGGPQLLRATHNRCARERRTGAL